MPETQLTSAKPEARLKELGVTLPAPPKPLASYIPWVQTGNLIFVSGQLPMKDGKVAFTGKVGKDLNVAKAQEAAVLACQNALAIVRDALGSLDKVKRVVRAVGHVNCAPGFTDVHVVTNGASDYLALIFGEKGKHTRLSLGAFELPLNAAFELDLIVEV